MSSRILLVDDNEEFRQSVADYVLRPAGYIVIEADDGITGLAVAAAHSPALIVADVQMPNMSGIAMAEALRAQGNDVPIVLVTAQGSEAVASRAIRVGAVGYLPKPFEPETLLRIIDKTLSERRLHQQVIDELRRSNAALERRVQQLEVMRDISAVLTSPLDLDTVLTRVVEAAVKLTDAEEGNLLLLDEATGDLTMMAAKNFDDEFVRAFRIKTDDSLAGQVLRTGEPYVLGSDAPQKIKTSYLVRSLIYVPLKAGNKVIGVLGVDNRTRGKIFSDDDLLPLTTLASYAAVAIQNARLYDEVLHERNKLEAILDDTFDVVMVVDNQRRVLLMNPAARQAFGVISDDVMGKRLTDFVRNSDLYTLFYSLDQVPELSHAEVTLEDGRTLNAHLSPIKGIGLALVMQDITHLKQLDKVKSEFVSAVSHDLRSPLTAILGYTELLTRVGEVNEMQQECINRVRISVTHITNLITDLLDLGRIEAGFDSQVEPSDMEQLVQYSLEAYLARAQSKQLRLVKHLSKVPRVMGSPARLRQMADNLIENAIKYTPDEGEITIILEDAGESVLLKVSDTGIGIAPQDQPHIFDKFYRGSDVPDDEPGTGLGLSIVKSIVDSHGGRIWVDSRVGQGTSFTVLMPTQRKTRSNA